jgi:hypothetical protein
MMRLLPDNLACTVVTHSPGIAVALVEKPRIEVILIGGRLFKHSVVASGPPLEVWRGSTPICFYGRDRRPPAGGFHHR